MGRSVGRYVRFTHILIHMQNEAVHCTTHIIVPQVRHVHTRSCSGPPPSCPLKSTCAHDYAPTRVQERRWNCHGTSQSLCACCVWCCELLCAATALNLVAHPCGRFVCSCAACTMVPMVSQRGGPRTSAPQPGHTSHQCSWTAFGTLFFFLSARYLVHSQRLSSLRLCDASALQKEPGTSSVDGYEVGVTVFME